LIARAASGDNGLICGTNDDNPNRCAFSTFSGVLYWDYGDSGGTGRVSWTPAGSWFGPYHIIALRAGTLGMELWSDGTKQASSGSSTSRSSSSETFGLASQPLYGGTLAGFGLLILANREWSDTEIMSWSANPWQIFQPARGAWLFPSAAAAATESLFRPATLSLGAGGPFFQSAVNS
jgi:hypothetical protein